MLSYISLPVCPSAKLCLVLPSFHLKETKQNFIYSNIHWVLDNGNDTILLSFQVFNLLRKTDTKTKQKIWKKQQMLAILCVCSTCAHVCFNKKFSLNTVWRKGLSIYADWPCIYSDTVTMLKLQFLFQYNGIIITTLTVLFLSLHNSYA